MGSVVDRCEGWTSFWRRCRWGIDRVRWSHASKKAADSGVVAWALRGRQRQSRWRTQAVPVVIFSKTTYSWVKSSSLCFDNPVHEDSLTSALCTGPIFADEKSFKRAKSVVQQVSSLTNHTYWSWSTRTSYLSKSFHLLPLPIPSKLLQSFTGLKFNLADGPKPEITGRRTSTDVSPTLISVVDRDWERFNELENWS
jgi:hypothetical protein